MLGKFLIYIGIGLIIIGLIVMYAGKFNFLGRLPGDITIKRENFTLYFPLMTSIVLSILISLIFYIIQKLR